MYRSKVVICGVDTARLKVLTEEEKQRLLLRMNDMTLEEADRRQARQDMIMGNLRLVLSLIQRFANRRESGWVMDDLFQVGCIGLIKAVDNFDPAREVMFSTYAVPMILGEVRRFLRDSATVRISRSTRDLAYRALSMREELTAEFQREPSVEEIATRLETPREQVAAAMEAIVKPMSLYEPVYSENGDPLYVIDQLSDTSRESSDGSWLENIALREAVSTLGPREQTIINLRFYQDKTQMEIASEIGISQAQVSRLEKAALEKLRRQL